jgi:hypothetical protein
MNKLGNCLTMVHSLRNTPYGAQRIAVMRTFLDEGEAWEGLAEKGIKAAPQKKAAKRSG